MNRYCSQCKQATEHSELKQRTFFQDCAIALISGFRVDLSEFELECNQCGKQRNK